MSYIHNLKAIALAIALGLALAAGGAWALPDGAVNVNTAGAEELAEMLNGVGKRRAAAIVEHREKFGDFTNFDDLEEVTGIGISVIERNKERIAFSD